MIRALILALALSACAPVVGGDVTIESRTSIIVAGKFGLGRRDQHVCSIAIEHNGVTHVYWTRQGCGVVHTEVIPPRYEKYAP